MIWGTVHSKMTILLLASCVTQCSVEIFLSVNMFFCT